MSSHEARAASAEARCEDCDRWRSMLPGKNTRAPVRQSIPWPSLSPPTMRPKGTGLARHQRHDTVRVISTPEATHIRYRVRVRASPPLDFGELRLGRADY